MRLLHFLSPSSSARRRGALGGSVLAGLALGLAVGLSHAAGEGPRDGGGGGPGAGLFTGPGGQAGPERMGRQMDRQLEEVGASPAQRAQVQQIVKAAAADLKPQHETGRALREQQMSLLAQPTVDASAVEQLRQKMLAHHDQVSRRMTQAMLDIARVLTPEQRTRLAERMKARGEGGHRQPRDRDEPPRQRP